MRKLSEIKGDEAFDVIADLLEPLSVIFTDEEVIKADNRVKKVATALRLHKRELITILAILEGVDAEKYAETMSLATLPKAAVDLFNDEDLSILF